MDTIQKFRDTIQAIPDFPKKGILFRDITPVLSHPELCREIVEQLAIPWKNSNVEAICGIESRGFLFGMSLAGYLGVPFVPLRKKGKLPGDTFSTDYQLEYGTATLEMRKNNLQQGQRVLIHDDLLATGGTARASADLVKQAGAELVGFSFLIELAYFRGETGLENHAEIHFLTSF